MRFLDIIQNIECIIAYIGDRDFDSFVKDRRTVDAVERCLQRITEVAIKLQPKATELLPDQNWKAMRDLGNRLRHDYDGIFPKAIWLTVRDDLPSLLKDCERAIVKLDSEKK